jgi:hypothetical protein
VDQFHGCFRVAHLTNPKEFWPRYPIPSVALDDPKYDPNQMWRGPTWVNVNYLMIEGLWRNGFRDQARKLRRATLEMIGEHNDIYEYYRNLCAISVRIVKNGEKRSGLGDLCFSRKKSCLPAKALAEPNLNNIPSEFWMTLAEVLAAT